MNYYFVFYLCIPPGAIVCAGRSIYASLQAGNIPQSGGDSSPAKQGKLEMCWHPRTERGPRIDKMVINHVPAALPPCHMRQTIGQASAAACTRFANYSHQRPDGGPIFEVSWNGVIDLTRFNKIAT